MGYIPCWRGPCLKKTARIKEKAFKIAQGIIKTWNEYLTGDVYCIVKETYAKNKDPIDYDVIGGYYGADYAKKCLETDL